MQSVCRDLPDEIQLMRQQGGLSLAASMSPTGGRPESFLIIFACDNSLRCYACAHLFGLGLK
jgi:hypothetical protein